jgi:hypothetical protein
MVAWVAMTGGSYDVRGLGDGRSDRLRPSTNMEF